MPQNFTSACAKILAAVCACDLVSIYRLEHWWHIENSGLYWNKRFLFFLPVNFSQEWSEFLRNAIDLKISGSKEPVAESARKFLGVSVANAEAWERLFDYIERRILANNALSLTNMYNTIGLYTVCHSDGVCVKGFCFLNVLLYVFFLNVFIKIRSVAARVEIYRRVRVAVRGFRNRHSRHSSRERRRLERNHSAECGDLIRRLHGYNYLRVHSKR